MNLIGIDLGVHKLAMVAFAGAPAYGLTNATSYEAPYSIDRDMQLRELGGVAQTWALMHEADQVWIEDVLIGNNRAYSIALAETKGAVMAHLAQLRPKTKVRTVNVQTWKREVVGKGNASKDEVRKYIDVTHPSYAPFCDGDQDRYDATCVGLYGLHIDALSRHLADTTQPGRLVDADRPDLA